MMRLKVEKLGHRAGGGDGPDDWCVVNLDEEPDEHNYWGMVAFGFVSKEDAEFYVHAYEANPYLYPFMSRDDKPKVSEQRTEMKVGLSLPLLLKRFRPR
jgi:hypothetical protein